GRVGARRHVEYIVVPDPDHDEARMEVARAAQLRHALGPERESEDQELECVAALEIAAHDASGDVVGRDLLEHARDVLARYGEVPHARVGVGAEAEAALRPPHLAAIELA